MKTSIITILLSLTIASAGCAFKPGKEVVPPATGADIPADRFTGDLLQTVDSKSNIKSLGFVHMNDGSIQAISPVLIPESIPAEGFRFSILTQQSPEKIATTVQAHSTNGSKASAKNALIDLLSAEDLESGIRVNMRIQNAESLGFRNKDDRTARTVSIKVGEKTFKVEFRIEPKPVQFSFHPTTVDPQGIFSLKDGNRFVKIGEIEFKFQSLDQKILIQRRYDKDIVTAYGHHDYQSFVANEIAPWNSPYSEDNCRVVAKPVEYFKAFSKSRLLFLHPDDSLQQVEAMADTDEWMNIVPSPSLSTTISVYAMTITADEYRRAGSTCHVLQRHSFPTSCKYKCYLDVSINNSCAIKWVIESRSYSEFLETVSVSGIGIDLTDYFERAVSVYGDMDAGLSNLSGRLDGNGLKHSISGSVDFGLPLGTPPSECEI